MTKLGTIKITHLRDKYECETCGWSVADGAKVTLPNGKVLDLTPRAHCFDEVSFTREEIFRKVLRELGYALEEEED